MSINYPTLSAAADLAHFRHFSSLLTNLRSTPVENVRQITPYLCKTNPISEMQNEHKCLYYNEICKFEHWFRPKNKAKTNPIQTQFDEREKLMQSVYIKRIMKKNTNMGPKKQTQFKPNFEKRRFAGFHR